MNMYNFANVLITNCCNLNCKHCYLDKSNSVYADAKEIYAILNKLAEMGIKSIQISGGECTIHPQFMDIIKYAKKLKFRVSIFTNGMKLSKICLKYIDNFFLSLDGTLNIHNYIRQNTKAYFNTIKTIKMLCQEKRTFSVQVTISKLNINSLDSLMECLYEYKEYINDIRLVKMIPIGSAKENNIAELTYDDILKLKKLKNNFAEMFRYKIPLLDDLYTIDEMNKFALCATKIFPLWINCYEGFAYVYADKSSYRITLENLTQKTCLHINTLVKQELKTKLQYVDKDIISIDDLLYM